MNNEEVICSKVSQMFAGRDWHTLDAKEKEIVADLQQSGWLETKKEPNGFIGKAL